MPGIDSISRKILYIISELGINPSRFIELLRKNNFNLIKTINFFCNKLNKFKSRKVDELINYLIKNNINVLNIMGHDYPAILKEIYFPPPLLFYKGDKIIKSKLNIAIVGTRKCSAYGIDVAKYISKQISSLDITIVSGLANGIDSYAHQAALEEKGGSIAVLGCGINIIYPPENEYLFEAIIHNGSLITEFLVDTPPLKHNFPQRNRIISGISAGVIVIEAGDKSGALITSEFALNQNREVFAVPGSIFNSESKGCHTLIKNGAKLVNDIDDILDELNQYRELFYEKYKQESFYDTFKKDINFLKNPIFLDNLSDDQRKIINFIGFKPKSIEEIVNFSGFDVKKILKIITELEMMQLINEKNLNSYVRIK